MRYAQIRATDVTNGEGFGVSLFVQGCHFHCFNCFNESTWDFNGGESFTEEIKKKLFDLLERKKDHISFFSVLGGEPLCPENIDEVGDIIKEVKNRFPNLKIFVWTGYRLPLPTAHGVEKPLLKVLENADYIIDSPYEDSKRDITLKWRGSSNQRIWHKINNEWIQEE